MLFNNVVEWLHYVERATIDELNEIISEDFFLVECLASKEIHQINEETILSIKEKLRKTNIESSFWKETLMFLNEKDLSTDLIEYFIDNDIAISTLGHLNMADNFLWKLSDVVDEAAITLGKRYYIDDKYSVEEFENLLKKFRNNHWLWSSLLDIIPTKVEKRKRLTGLTFKITNFQDLKRWILEDYKAKVLEKTNKLNIINRYYRKQNPRFLKAIAKNPITPENILNELIKVKSIKYASQIRKLAENNLRKR